VNIALTKTPAEEAFGVALPHRRMEEWRWTDLRRSLDKPYPTQKVVAADKDVSRLTASSPFANFVKYRAVFVNGTYAPQLSVIPAQVGIQLSKGEDAVKLGSRLRGNDGLESDPVVVLNTSLKAMGIVIRFDEAFDVPVEIIHVATQGADRAMAIRNRIEVGEGASATIIETFVGEGDYVLNAVTDINLGAGARLDRVKVELESRDATHLSYVDVTLAKDAKLNEFTLTSGSALNRQNGNYLFDGENVNAYIAGAYLLNGKQHADTRLVMDHKVPHCTSREMFKCVMDENARGIFQGKVIVRKHAQKTDGKQSSHALLLSESAEFDAKPELEIYADDVVCGHGATAGDINHDHLFYLMSRGIPKAEAKSLLIGAFVGEAFDAIVNDAMREAMVSFAESWLGRRD
jgi:Fe-S cluster assembly protein SufD